MIRRPPRSTLFPTRRSSDLNVWILRVVEHAVLQIGQARVTPQLRLDQGEITLGGIETGVTIGQRDHQVIGKVDRKSHTSELQSRQYLVCRLLLEKKKHTHIM